MTMQFTLAFRYLQGRKLRTFFTTLAVVLGVAMIVAVNGMIPAIMQSFQQNMLAAAGMVDLSVTSETRGGFGGGVLEMVRQTPGIAHAAGSLRRNLLLPAGSPVNAVTVVGLDGAAQQVRAYSVTEGRFLQPGDGNALLIGKNLALQMELGVGDTLTLPSTAGATDFEIVGILAGRVVPGVEEVLMPLAAAQTLYNQPGEINTVEALFTPDVERAAVEADVRARVGDEYTLSALESGSEFLASIEIGKVVVSVFGLLALVMGGFVIFNTFRAVVAERRRDLGMLRAVGASRKTVVGLILAESLLQGIAGAAVGLILGYALMVGIVVLLNPIMQSYMRFRVGTPAPPLSYMAAAVVLGVGMTVLGGLWPALSASRVTPLEALRPNVGEAYQRVARRRALVGAALVALALVGLLSGQIGLALLGTVLFLVGMLLVAPALIRPIARVFGRLLALAFAREGQIAQGNVSRQPGRAAITASALMVGLAIVVMATGMASSLVDGFMNMVDKNLGADFIFMPPSLLMSGGNVGAGPELAERIRQTPGVAIVTTLRMGTSEANGAPLQVIGIDPATYPQVSGLDFSAGDEAQAYAKVGAGRAIVVNGVFALQNSVRVGDTLTLQAPEGERDYRVVGIGMDFMNAKLATGYISQANLAADFHQTNDLLLMANKTPEADLATVHNALETVIRDYPIFTLFDSAQWRASQRDTLAGAMNSLYVVVVALALPSLVALVNTLVINVIERTREIGMIRAVGGTRQQIRRMILAESLLLAAAGAAFGILAGLWLGHVLVGMLKIAGFTLPYYFPFGGILFTIAVGLLFGVLASLVPARQAARLDIVAALHYE
jgi:putative ABC transport system permease protein